MMKTLKQQLDVIIFAEMKATKARRILSTQALGNYTKLSRSKTEDLVKKAIDDYNIAKSKNEKISRYSIPKKKKELVEQKEELFSNEIIKPIKTILFNIPDAKSKTLLIAGDYAKKQVIENIKKYFTKYKPFKIHVALNVEMIKPLNKKESQIIQIRFFGGYKIETIQDIDKIERQFMEKVNEKFDDMSTIGSGHSLKKVISGQLTLYKGKKMRGSSYIATPDEISNANCGLVNIRNDDQKCFQWCLLYHQSEKTKHSARITALKKITDKYNYEYVNFPASAEDIQTFENNNVETSVNVFSFYNDYIEIDIIRRSSSRGSDRINLLIISENDNEHYVYISNMAKLFKTSSKHHHISLSVRIHRRYSKTGGDMHTVH